jgi:hypothetical protein
MSCRHYNKRYLEVKEESTKLILGYSLKELYCSKQIACLLIKWKSPHWARFYSLCPMFQRIYSLDLRQIVIIIVMQRWLIGSGDRNVSGSILFIDWREDWLVNVTFKQFLSMMFTSTTCKKGFVTESDVKLAVEWYIFSFTLYCYLSSISFSCSCTIELRCIK